jgi:hypothetical protein
MRTIHKNWNWCEQGAWYRSNRNGNRLYMLLSSERHAKAWSNDSPLKGSRKFYWEYNTIKIFGDENSVEFSPQANYTDWATATCWRNLVPTFADRGLSRGKPSGSRTVVNLSFLDRRYLGMTVTNQNLIVEEIQRGLNSENLLTFDSEFFFSRLLKI